MNNYDYHVTSERLVNYLIKKNVYLVFPILILILFYFFEGKNLFLFMAKGLGVFCLLNTSLVVLIIIDFWIVNKNTSISITESSFLVKSKSKETEIRFSDIKKIVRNVNFRKRYGGFIFFPWLNLEYTEVIDIKGERYVLTSLLIEDLNHTLFPNVEFKNTFLPYVKD